MNIAIVNTEYPYISGKGNGGITTYVITLSKLLSEMGHAVFLFSREGFRYESSFLPLVKPYFFGFKKSRRFLVRFLEKFSNGKVLWEKGMARGLTFLLKEVREKIDIIEIPEYGGLGCFFKKNLKTPYVVTFHTPSKLIDLLNNTKLTSTNQEIYQMERLTIKKGDAFKSPSISLKNWCVDYYKIDPSQISVIPNPFIAEPFFYIRKGNEEKLYFNILFPGRLEPRKGAGIIFECVKELLSISPKIRLIIAGETEINDCPNYKKMITEKVPSEDRERLIFTGAVSQEEMVKLYKEASLVIIPSLFENFPYVMLEAMAASLPVIASCKGGMGEFIIDGQNGFTFDPLDISELLEKTRRIFFNPNLALQLGLNAVNTIKDKLNPSKIVEEHINFYKKVIEKKINLC